MVYKNLGLPATLIHSVNGKKYTLNGKLLAVNESSKTCTMQFGDKQSENIPLTEVYLNEAALSDLIKKTGKKLKDVAGKLWEKIKGIVKIVGGWLVPVDQDGNELIQYINNPLNLAVMPLPSSISYAPSERTIALCEENGAKVRNTGSLDEAFGPLIDNDKNQIETYWSRVMKEYVKNESLTLSDTVKLVNESYYQRETIDGTEPINEAVVSLKSPNERMYGRFVNTNELIKLITDNIFHQMHPLYVHKKGDSYVKPLLIWGAPGIGKTAVIKQAAKFMKENYNTKLDLVTMACGGIKVDDFSLPDTAKNQYGQEIAVEIPKTWLPVYDIDGLSKEQIERLDAFYNSGKYRIRDFMSDDLKDRKDKNGENVLSLEDNGVGESYDGGILFFDEFARLRQQKVMDVMMTLCGDRTYQKMILASGWSTIAAANRLTDDKLPENNVDFRSLWGEAMKTRFTHLTFVPTKVEWLRWAREVNEDGYQNVDELICKFIEKSPDGVWYDALDFGSREIADPDVARILGVDASSKGAKGGSSSNGTWGTNDLTRDELRKVSKYNSDVNANVDNMEMIAWNGRTWDQKISRVFLSGLRQLFYGHPDWYEDCFSTQKRIRELNGGASSEEYIVKNIDVNKLKTQLNKVPRDRWFNWTKGIYEKIDPSQNSRNNDRYDFLMKYLGYIIESETGKGGVPSKAWDHYNSIDSVIDEIDIREIYNKGQLRSTAARRDDNMLFDTMADYSQATAVNWKSNIANVDEVISIVLDALPKYITVDEIIKDQKRIEKFAGKYAATPADLQMFKDEYTLHLTDENGKEIKTVPTLFSKALEYNEDLEERVTFVLKQSGVAKKLANVAMWISKVAIQINQNTPITAALGIEGEATDGTLADRVYKIMEGNQEAMAFYEKDSEIRKYRIMDPAIVILKAMRFYRQSQD